MHPLPRTILFLKAHVPAHSRRTGGGATVNVTAYETRRAAARAADPHDEDMRTIHQHIARYDRSRGVRKYDRAEGMRMGREPSRRVQDRIEEEAVDAMRGAVHAMHRRGVQEGTPHHAIVQAGIEAFGHPDQPRPGSIDPEGFMERFRAITGKGATAS